MEYLFHLALGMAIATIAFGLFNAFRFKKLTEMVKETKKSHDLIQKQIKGICEKLHLYDDTFKDFEKEFDLLEKDIQMEVDAFRKVIDKAVNDKIEQITAARRSSSSQESLKKAFKPMQVDK